MAQHGAKLRRYCLDLCTPPDKRTTHLSNLAQATLKDLIYNGESESIRLQAVRELLALPMVQERHLQLAEAVRLKARVKTRGKDDVTSQIEALVEDGGDEARAIIDAILPANLPELPAKPKKTNGNP